MTTSEREELLRLWGDVPDCKPQNLHWTGTVWEVSVEPGDTGSFQRLADEYAGAIARDAMVGYIMEASDGMIITIGSHCEGGWWVSSFDTTTSRDPESRMFALIDTCRKVAAKNPSGKDSA